MELQCMLYEKCSIILMQGDKIMKKRELCEK
jgi:hypothetical protein